MRAFVAIGAATLAVTAMEVLCAWAADPAHTIDAARALDASTAPAVAISSTPADPEPLVERNQWVLDVQWDRGEVRLLAARKVDLGAARPTPRAMGRFALELYEGRSLLERMRFDFPLLGAGDVHDASFEEPPSLAKKLRTRTRLFFPAVDRGTRFELLDRATNRRWGLPWPPAAPEPR
jgi:hypothetical protein